MNQLSLKDDFPILSREVNGHPLIYLDNAATTQKPQVVIDAMSQYYSNSNANVHRAVHTLAGEATEGYEDCRRWIKSWFNAEKAILTGGTTEAINLVAHGWGRANLQAGDAIVLTEMEHHSDIVPWQILSEERGIEIRYVPVLDDFTLDMEAYMASLENAKLVCVVHTSNVLGVRNPVDELISLAHKAGAKILIDAAQAVPHDRIDFEQFNADFMAFSAHKMCGPTGIGALLVKNDAFEQMQPFMGGGDMIESVTTSGSTYQTNEHKFEAGTPKIAEAVGWSAAFDWMSKIDLPAHHERLLNIAKWTAEQLRGLGFTVYGRHQSGDAAVVSFLHPTIHSEDFARFLDAKGFAVRTGHHCAQPLLNRLGITGTIRASFYLYNTQDEAEKFIEIVQYIVEKFA